MTQESKKQVLARIKKAARYIGISLFVPICLWFFMGFFPAIPSIIDVFGIENLRIPTAVVIAGLMLAAFGFEDF